MTDIRFPVLDMRLPAQTPRVSRSNMLYGGQVIAIEGSQFEDGLRRLVVAPDASDSNVVALSNALAEIDREEGLRRWLLDLLTLYRTEEGTHE